MSCLLFRGVESNAKSGKKYRIDKQYANFKPHSGISNFQPEIERQRSLVRG